MSEFRLVQNIIALSKASAWDVAKREWELADVYREDEPETCLCGHFPINEICVLRNRKNGHKVKVGNICVKKFLGLPSDKIFQALNRVEAEPEKALNPETIQHAHDRKWINDWERGFYLDTWRKRRLSAKQLTKRVQINQRVLARVIRKKNLGTH